MKLKFANLAGQGTRLVLPRETKFANIASVDIAFSFQCILFTLGSASIIHAIYIL